MTLKEAMSDREKELKELEEKFNRHDKNILAINRHGQIEITNYHEEELSQCFEHLVLKDLPEAVTKKLLEFI